MAEYKYVKWVPATRWGKFLNSLVEPDRGKFSIYRDGKRIYVLTDWTENAVKHVVTMLNREANR